MRARPWATSSSGPTASRPEGVDRLEVHGGVADPERVREPAQLGRPGEDRLLAALEARGDLGARLLALGPAAGGLAALAAGAAPDAPLRVRRALRRGEVVELHDTSSTCDEVRDAGDHATDLGAVGQHVGLADAAQPERAQRAAVLGLRPDRRADLGDLELGHGATSPRPRTGRPRDGARGRRAARPTG